MYPVVYLNCDLKSQYSKYTFFSRIKDSINTTLIGENYIKELGLKIAQVKLPPNFNKKAYMRNIENSRRLVPGKQAVLSPKTLRLYDYKVLNSFQKDLMAYGIMKSIQLILRSQGKSIRNSCILINDITEDLSIDVLKELAKHARYIVLISNTVGRMTRLRDSITADYGITPVITNDEKYAFEAADFIITSKEVKCSYMAPIWYIDNSCSPNGANYAINDVSFKVPWDTELSEMSPELLGGILGQMGEREIDRSLKYNGVFLDKIKFNDNTIEL